MNGKDNKYNFTLKKGDEVIIRAEKMYQPMVFISNHDNIAYMSTTGVLSARTEGTAKLTAKAYGKKITITVTVTP